MSRWQDYAACKGMTHLMYPSRGDYEGLQRSLAICESCTVVAECFDLVMELGEPEGVWAGTTGRQRRALRAEAGRPSVEHGTRSKYVGGCRCESCTDANRSYQSKWRNQGKGPAEARTSEFATSHERWFGRTGAA